MKPKHSTGKTAPRRPGAEPFWLAVLLAMLLVGVKATLLPAPAGSLLEGLKWFLRLGVVSAADVGFALGLGVAASLLCIAAARWMPQAEPAVRWAVRGAFFLSSVYAVLSWALLQATLQPFNLRVLYLVGDWRVLWSSLTQYVTWMRVLALVAVPAGLVLLGCRLARRWSRAPGRLSPVGLLLLAALAWLPLWQAARSYVNRRWPSPRIWEHRLARSPHLELLGSCWQEWFSAGGFTPVALGSPALDPVELGLRPPAASGPARTAWPLKHRPRHVVVVMLESVGAEYVDWAGGRYRTMPHLARRIRKQGVVVPRFYVAAPYSCKSLLALCGSAYPRPDWRLVVQEGVRLRGPLLPQVLAQHGVRSCFAHSGYWSWRNRDRFLRAHGVDRLIDAAELPGPPLNSWGVPDRQMFDAVLAWLKRRAGQPSFALAYTIQTHHPYPRPRHTVRFPVQDPELQSFLNAIRATDEELERFLQRLEAAGLLDETLVIVTADHGESFGQHDQREHHFALYEPNVRVPLALLYPGLRQALGRELGGVRSQIDLAPTVLDALGIPQPEPWQGSSLFRPEPPQRPVYLVTVSNYAVLGLRQGRWKYHYWVEQGQEELYDLESDPTEQHNLAARHPELCRRFRRRLSAWVRYQQRFLDRYTVP